MTVSAQEIKKNVTVKVKGGYELKGSVEQTDDSVKITTENGDVFVYRANEILSITDAAGNTQKTTKKKAREKTFFQKGYMGYVDLALGAEAYYGDGMYVQITTTHGYRFTPHVFVGAGTGVGIFSGRAFIPLYAACRVSILKDKRVTPYVNVNVGYNLDPSGTEWSPYNQGGSSYSGAMVAPSIGIEIATNRRLAFYIAADCNLIFCQDNGRFISGKIGVAF